MDIYHINWWSPGWRSVSLLTTTTHCQEDPESPKHETCKVQQLIFGWCSKCRTGIRDMQRYTKIKHKYVNDSQNTSCKPPTSIIFFCGNLDVIFGCDNWAVGGGLLVVLELWYFNGISRGSIRIQENLTLMKFEEILCEPKQKQKLLWPFCGYCVSSNHHVQIYWRDTLPETNIAPENGWLEY